MTVSTVSHREKVPASTTGWHGEERGTRRPPDPGPSAIEGSDDSDNTLQARYGVWIQTLKNHPIGIHEGVYLSTFQRGRGQHVTALDTGQARKLGERLIALADEIEAEASVLPAGEDDQADWQWIVRVFSTASRGLSEVGESS